MAGISACSSINPLPMVATRRTPLQRSRMHWSCGSCPLRTDATVVNRVGRFAMFASGARPTSFLDARSGEELLSCIKEGVNFGKLPPKIAAGMEELYRNYKNAVFQSSTPLAEDIVLSNMSVLLDRILLEIEDPFTFPPYHRAIREPFDYYMLGQKYIQPLVDFRRSYIGNIETFQEIEDKLKKGHNIVLVSNHQTEADPAVIALLVEATNPRVAEEMTYVAGDRVVTDPLCKPFSMGRNLLCVYSKKHLYDVPELVEMKKRSNTRTLKEMALLLRTGGQIIWIAPSGGRDRPDISTGRCYPAIFDSSSIDNLRRLIDHSGVPGHLYPLALLCYDIMPPPAKVEKQIGERRDVFFHGVGLSIGKKVHVEKIAAGLDSSEEIKSAFSQAMYDNVKEQYSVLESAIYDHKGLHASNSTVSLSQPWE